MLDQVWEHRLVDQLDPIQYGIRLLVPPGSDLLAQPDTLEWLGPLDPDAFTYRWEHPDPRMDRLHAAVMTCVEQAQKREEDPLRTYLAIRELAREAAGSPWSASPDRDVIRAGTLARRAERGRPPRLTESWFC